MTEPEDQNPPELERLTDTSDIATSLEMSFTANALLDVRAKTKRDQEPVDGVYLVVDCEECGSEIGDGRLRVAARNHLCVYCAAKEERRAKR